MLGFVKNSEQGENGKMGVFAPCGMEARDVLFLWREGKRSNGLACVLRGDDLRLSAFGGESEDCILVVLAQRLKNAGDVWLRGRSCHARRDDLAASRLSCWRAVPLVTPIVYRHQEACLSSIFGPEMETDSNMLLLLTFRSEGSFA